jgi:hypothetical protein
VILRDEGQGPLRSIIASWYKTKETIWIQK